MNRTYIAKLNATEQVKVTWLNGAQYCSWITKGEEADLPQSKEATSIIEGKTGKMTYKDLRKEVLAGHTVYNRQGKKIPCTKMAERTPDKAAKVIVSNKGETKVYQIL